MNSIIDIQADPYTNINTDRKAFEIKIRQKLKARTQPNREPTLKGIKPEKDEKTREEAIEEYNSKFRELVEEEWETEGMEIGQLYKLTKIAARHAFNKPRTRGKRQDCDARLRRIINDRKIATVRHDDITVKRPTRELKKLVRKIKPERLLSELRDNKWDPVKMRKKGYTPKHTKLKDMQGRQVHDRLRATTFADYYEQKHWAIEPEEREDISEEPILPTNMEVETGEITT